MHVDSGQEGYWTEETQDMRETRQDRREAGPKGGRTGWRHERRETGQEGGRKGRRQKSREAGPEGGRI